MGNISVFGTAMALIPPIVVGGVAYSLALRFKTPEAGPGAAIVSGHVESVSSLGGGLYRVVCRRAMVTFSYTRPQLEVEYQALCGGNIVNTPEPMRFYSWVNPEAVRGDLSDRRAIVGDMLWFGPPGGEEGAYIVEAIPFGELPATVNYAGDEPGETVSYAVLDWLELYLPQPIGERSTNPNAAINLALGGDWFTGNGALFVRETTEDPYTALTRKAFGTDQPELYPADAALAEGEYWLGGESCKIRVSSYNASLGALMLASWWEGPFDRLTPGSGRVMVQQGAGAGYDPTGEADARVAFVTPTTTDFDLAILLLPNASESFGVGAIEVDFPDAGRRIALAWSGTAFTDLLARTADGGGMEAESFAATTLSGSSFAVTVRKDGGLVSFWAGASLIGSVDFGLVDVPVVAFGRVGVATWEGGICKWYGLEGREVERQGAGGRLDRLNFTTFPEIEYSTEIDLPTGTTIESAVGRAYGTYSTAGSARRRNHYSRSGDTLTFYSETAGDVIRIQQAAAGSAPTPPGRCPRPGSAIINFATVDPESGDDFLPTSDPAENVANGSDVVIVKTNGRAPGPGDPFIIRRNAGMDPTEPWSLNYDTKGEEGPDWTVLASSESPGSNVLARASEASFMVRKGWVDELGSAKPCWQLTGTFVEHRANLDARTINDLAGATEALEELYSEQPTNGTSVQVAGWMESARMVNTSFACSHPTSCAGNSTGLMMGVTWEAWNRAPSTFEGRLGNIAAFAGGLPAVMSLTSSGGPGLVLVDSLTGTFYTTDDYVEMVCCTDGGGPRGYNTKSTGTTARKMYLWPYDNGEGIGGVPEDYAIIENGFGADCFAGDTGQPYTWGHTQFRFAGVGFDIPERLQRAPKGCTISAFVRVKFTGIQNRAWTITQSGLYPRNSDSAASFDPSGTLNHSCTINGVEVLRITPSEGGPIVVTNPEPASVSTASVAFVVVGRRLDSKPVFANLSYANQLMEWIDGAYTPTEEELAAARAAATFNTPSTGSGWQSFSSIQTPTVVEDGKWTLVAVDLGPLFAARESLCSQFQLFPSQGVALLGTAPGGLRDYLVGLDPVTSITTTNPDDDFHSYAFTAAGQFTAWDQLEVEEIQIRIRYLDGTLDDFVLPPIARGKMTP
jgi:hypothetical protein